LGEVFWLITDDNPVDLFLRHFPQYAAIFFGLDRAFHGRAYERDAQLLGSLPNYVRVSGQGCRRNWKTCHARKRRRCRTESRPTSGAPLHGYGTGYSYPAYTGYSYPAYGYGYGTGYSLRLIYMAIVPALSAAVSMPPLGIVGAKSD
jgi:hypothetical protein